METQAATAGSMGVGMEMGAEAGASIAGAGAGVKIICCSLRPATMSYNGKQD
jgi:hypothetical protein